MKIAEKVFSILIIKLCLYKTKLTKHHLPSKQTDGMLLKHFN